MFVVYYPWKKGTEISVEDGCIHSTVAAEQFQNTIGDRNVCANGLATAVARMKDSDAKSRGVILLTDGVNNRGEIGPLMAADIAADMGIKVYTVGVGTRGKAPYPVVDMFGNVSYQMMPVEIDEKTLEEIASRTGGRYFRATDKGSLYEVYERINKLEKSRIETDEFVKHNELYGSYLLWALVLLLAEFVVRRLWLNTIP